MILKNKNCIRFDPVDLFSTLFIIYYININTGKQSYNAPSLADQNIIGLRYHQLFSIITKF